MPYGYIGKILHVDLSGSALTIEEPPESFYRKYLGGSAMGMEYILRGMKPGVDPLSPDNILTLMAGVSTGAAISGQSRLNANAKSPISGGIGDSQSGGFFPAELKFAGFDGIVIKGKSPKPVYLSIVNGKAELRDAAHLMGKITGEVDIARYPKRVRDALRKLGINQITHPLRIGAKFTIFKRYVPDGLQMPTQ